MKRLLIIIPIITSVLFEISSMANTINTVGNTVTVALPITVAGISLKKHDADGLKEFLLSLGVAATVTVGLKYAVNEKRPNGRLHSFPSEHAAVAFSSAGYLWRRYGYAYGIPATLLAGFVGLSRVEAHQHYWHDVLGGAAIGLLSSIAFTKPLQITCYKHGVEIGYTEKF